MIRAVYTVMLALAAPFMWYALWRRARREGGEWGVLAAARFGRYRRGPVEAGRVWVHAVSLGEVRAAKPLLDALLSGGSRILLTHTTATAWAESQRAFPAAIASGQLALAWLPYDFPRAMNRFFMHYRPRVGVLIEREVWPNLVAAANRRAVPLVLASARLSARSAAGMRRLRWLMRPAFAGIDLVLAQTRDDARRLLALGCAAPRVIGNFKFDIALPEAALAAGLQWRAAWGRPVLTLASTRDGEEAAFIESVSALPELPENILFLLIPRHPQRFPEIASLLAAGGMAWQRRSQLHDPATDLAPDTRWLLGDSVGEMPAYYAASDVAIIGGSFEDFGGQNLVEACAAGAPVIVGPHTRNFAQASEDAIACGAALRVPDARAAIDAGLALLTDVARRQAMAQSARAFVAAHRGATRKAVSALRPWL